jgi:hypothetical protein
MVDRFQISGDLLAQFPGYVVQTVSYHANDAEQDLRRSKDHLDRVVKAFESIDTGDEDTLNTFLGRILGLTGLGWMSQTEENFRISC